jgi:hypothetical protein
LFPKRFFFFGRPAETRIGWPTDVDAEDIPQLVGEQSSWKA